jgi:hypothetical protein
MTDRGPAAGHLIRPGQLRATPPGRDACHRTTHERSHLAAGTARGPPRSVCDDRPGSPLDRTLREDRRRDRRYPLDGHAAATQRQRTGLPGARAGAARVQQAPAIRPPADQQRSNLAGWAQYGYCASHSRFFWGLRSSTWSARQPACRSCGCSRPRSSASEVLSAMLEVDAGLVAAREGILLISDKGFASRPFEQELLDHASSCCGLRASARRSGTASRCSKRSAS